MEILKAIIASKKQEVDRQKEVIPVDSLEDIILENDTPRRSFRQALLNSTTGIIAEFKRKSPSKGWLFEHASVERIVCEYEVCGAAAVSLLTDEPFFGGTFEDFTIARKHLNIPLLRKDFIIDPYQIYQSKALQADVILLIAAALSPDQTAEYTRLAHQLDMEVLLEIHDEKELAYLDSNDIDVVGINNRNLATFVTDVRCSFELNKQIPPGHVKISESGISSAATVKDLRNAGFNGFLIGEHFMKTNEPGKALHRFIHEIV